MGEGEMRSLVLQAPRADKYEDDTVHGWEHQHGEDWV